MKKVLKIFLISFIFLITFSGKSYSAVLSANYITDEVRKSLISQISHLVNGNVNVKVNSIPYKSLHVSNGAVKVEATVNTKFITPLTVARVKILVNNNEETSFGVPVQISIEDKVWVVKDNIRIGESLSSAKLALESRDISYLIGNAANEEFYPSAQIVKKNFKIGDILDMRYVQTPPDVVKSSIVSVLFQTNSVTITISAESLEDGKLGDYIKVRSKKYRKDYTAKVIDTNTVLVSL